MSMGELSKTLKRGFNRTDGRGHKDFKTEGKAGSRGGCLKKGRGWIGPLLLTMIFIIFQINHQSRFAPVK